MSRTSPRHLLSGLAVAALLSLPAVSTSEAGKEVFVRSKPHLNFSSTSGAKIKGARDRSTRSLRSLRTRHEKAEASKKKNLRHLQNYYDKLSDME